MKRIKALFIFLWMLTISASLAAQPLSDPVNWTVSARDEGSSEYAIKVVGTFDSPEWHIYDMTRIDDGPVPTALTIDGAEIMEAPHITSKVSKSFDQLFGAEIGTCSDIVVIEARVRSKSSSSINVTVEWQACREGMCMPPDSFSASVALKAESRSKSDLPGHILQAIAWGFVALLTPCVFPMIPMTVSFFLKQNGEKKRKKGKWLALFFGVSIIALFTVPVAILIAISLLSGGQAVTADIFNFLATHWIPNLLFFFIFMAFAASFFGAFEITLPAGLVNKSDSKSESGGIVGAFFVALTLVLVSFSCTGPIVGTVLIKSARGDFWEPVLTMFAFALAFSLPFTLFAFAPSLLKKIPRSGSWLGSVKIVLGFIEIALGFKFLSVADQTYHWGVLGRETYLAIWIIVFALLGLYLLGKIRFRGESPLEYISVTRLWLAIAVFSFVVYMIPGMWGAPLKALSGYLPPITTQDFVLDRTETGPSDNYSEVVTAKYSDFLGLPYGIPAYFDYEEALVAAKNTGKPLLVDFTGHGCVNCREMETRVWSDPRVLKLMKEDYVVCALYADDKKTLPKEDWVRTGDGKMLKSLGKINSYFALRKFNVNAQPYYAILDPYTEEHKVTPRGYNLNVDEFIGFLEAGLQ